MSATASRIVYRHRHAGCDGSVPLNLAERELITGRSLTQFDEETGLEFCVDCLADLPRDGYEALFHVCGEEPPAPSPEPESVPEQHAEESAARTVPAARVGDTVRYCGSLTGYRGTVWEVTHKDARGLILFDVDRALWNVQQESVIVVGRKKRQRAKRKPRH